MLTKETRNLINNIFRKSLDLNDKGWLGSKGTLWLSKTTKHIKQILIENRYPTA